MEEDTSAFRILAGIPTENVPRMEDDRRALKILTGKRPLGRLRRRWEGI